MRSLASLVHIGAIIGVVLTFWIHRSTQRDKWETDLNQYAQSARTILEARFAQSIIIYNQLTAKTAAGSTIEPKTWDIYYRTVVAWNEGNAIAYETLAQYFGQEAAELYGLSTSTNANALFPRFIRFHDLARRWKVCLEGHCPDTKANYARKTRAALDQLTLARDNFVSTINGQKQKCIAQSHQLINLLAGRFCTLNPLP